MLRAVIAVLLLTLSLSSPSALAEGRVLILNGYVDGLPFPRRIKEEIRNQLEENVPGIVVHSQSLDIYRPQSEEYKQLLVDLITHTYADQIDLIVALDPNAFFFYRERLSKVFSDVPVIYSNDRGTVTDLRANEYSLLIRPNFRETLRIARHHIPDLKRIYLVGDEYNQELTQTTLEGLIEGIELVELGGLPLQSMRDEISKLGAGDLLFFQLLFADGEGTPMVPPIRYLREFSGISPVPTVCMYANFIAQGCLGGSVSSPQDQAGAIVEAIQTFTYDEASLPTATWERLAAPPTGQVLRRFASQSLVDYPKLTTYDLDRRELPGVTYLNKPAPIYQGYARELSIAAIGALALLVVLTIYLSIVQRQRNVLHRFAALTDNVPTGIFWLDDRLRRWHHNSRIEQWANELNRPVHEIREAAMEHLLQQLEKPGDFELNDGKNGRFFRVRATEFESHPEILLLEDTTVTHEYQRRLQQQAMIDDLTGLPNRRTLNISLKRWCASSRRDANPFAVMLIDLDGFKPINDQHGHATGDHVLATISERLQSRTRQNDLFGRLGGDEFLLLAEGVTNREESQQLCDQIQSIIREPIECTAADRVFEVSVGASVGVALCPTHSTDAGELLLLADRAMYQVKERGKGTWGLYQPPNDEALDA
ncbi:MAG: diguanylate cyclase [Oceanospirillaceae bacterium]|nr:diguanylate cyclase [Oceanospirillaceae bacterium]